MEPSDDDDSKNKSSNLSLIFITIQVNNRSMRVMVDTESSGSFISTSALLKLGYYQPFTKVKEYWLADDIIPLEVLGMVKLTVKIGGIITKIQASITKTLTAEYILGSD
ncbi:unnamed protein product [Didymodactylos carnosus]|uniref:Uncharacterized protein n=1 Tax=Didymodactylos carnosus TaxID=1234261 RepID=A0A8S2FH15_9BILA|nr:unnamed protein product [Didymodactylos carnosus]CAF4259023.1 unnamed protein product [Didymodactylos carnosus]